MPRAVTLREKQDTYEDAVETAIREQLKDIQAMEPTDRIARGFTDALRLLQQTADGKFSLGALDAVANDKLDARFECAPSVFSRRQLGAFR